MAVEKVPEVRKKWTKLGLQQAGTWEGSSQLAPPLKMQIPLPKTIHCSQNKAHLTPKFLLNPISMAGTKCRARHTDHVSIQSPHKPTARKWTFQEKYWSFFFQGFWEGVSHSTPNKGEFPEEHSREVTKRGEFIHRGKIPVPSGKPLPLDAFEGSWTQWKAFLQSKFSPWDFYLPL